MKRSIIYTSLSVLAASMIIGCGGGGGSSATLAKLDKKTLDTLGNNIASALPVCVYTSDTSTVGTNIDFAIPYKKMIDDIDSQLHAKHIEAGQPHPGACGGHLTIVENSHLNGNTAYTFTYDNFCSTDALGVETTLNGEMNVFEDGHGTAGGPVADSTKFSTGAKGLETEVKGETKTTYLDDLIVTDNKVTAKELKVANSNGKQFSVTGLEATLQNKKLQIKSAIYHDPDTGDIQISSLPMNLDGSDGMKIKLVGSDGTAAELDGNSAGVFTIKNSNGPVGGLDCSALF